MQISSILLCFRTTFYPGPPMHASSCMATFGMQPLATWLFFHFFIFYFIKTISQTSFCKIIALILVFQIILILQIFILRIFFKLTKNPIFQSNVLQFSSASNFHIFLFLNCFKISMNLIMNTKYVTHATK